MEEILKKIKELKDEIQTEYQKLKNDSKTYRELEEKIRAKHKEMSLNRTDFRDVIYSEMYKLLKTDTDNLRI